MHSCTDVLLESLALSEKEKTLFCRADQSAQDLARYIAFLHVIELDSTRHLARLKSLVELECKHPHALLDAIAVVCNNHTLVSVSFS